MEPFFLSLFPTAWVVDCTSAGKLSEVVFQAPDMQSRSWKGHEKHQKMAQKVERQAITVHFSRYFLTSLASIQSTTPLLSLAHTCQHHKNHGAP